MKLIYNILFFCLLSTNLFAQNDKILKDADKKFNNFAYVDAREIYLDVAKSGYKSENLFKKLGDSYYFNNELVKSLEWYEKLVEFQKNVEPTYLFRYSMALKSVKRYKEADDILEKYNQSIPESDIVSETSKHSSNDLMTINSDKYTVEKTNINSAFSDYAPTYCESKLVFVSNRKSKEETQSKNHQWNNQPFSDLYSVNIKKGNILDADIQKFSSVINSPYHESSATFSKDGKTIYFSRNNYNENKYKTNAKGVNLVKIYKSTKGEDGEWKTPIELSFNSDEYSCAHPALSPDEKKLYFSSDMPGTKGMSDIYVSEIYSDGTFGTPINLGGKINTNRRESYPFLTKQNQFFFSSDGHYGLGGFDIFVTELKEDYEVGEIMNLGSPINSSTDDFSLILDTNDNTGFFASNKNNGSGSDDIYSFKLKESFVTSCKQQISGFVKNEKNGQPIKNIKVQAYDLSMSLIKSVFTDKDGLYLFELECNKKYIIRASGDGIQTTESVISTDEKFDKKLSSDIFPKVGNDLGNSKTKYGDDLGISLQLEPIYFDFDKNVIRPDAEVELQKIISFLKKFTNTFVDVRSHTDSQGERDYNLSLSNMRAKSTIDYIVNNGISRDRISGKGYGDTQLINNCIHGVDCSEEMHKLNRRSEFILIDYKKAIQEKKNEIQNTIEPTIIVNQEKVNSISNNSEKKIEIQTTVEPTILIKEVEKTQSISNKTVSKPIENKNLTTTKGLYDFSSTKQVYTVQLAAVSNVSNIPFKLEKNIYSHKYSDGLTRFFSGTFETYDQAQKHKEELINKGFKQIFLTILKGEERIKAQ